MYDDKVYSIFSVPSVLQEAIPAAIQNLEEELSKVTTQAFLYTGKYFFFFFYDARSRIKTNNQNYIEIAIFQPTSMLNLQIGERLF